MNREVKFILDVLQDKPCEPPKDLDWYYVLGFLELNKTGGYFFARARDAETALPQAVERKLSQTLRAGADRNALLRGYIRDIGDALRSEKTAFAFLKGSVLSNTNFLLSEKARECMFLYGDAVQKYRDQASRPFYGAGERISNDIDILVEQKDITAVSEILKYMGFVQGYYDFGENKIVPLSRAEILARRMNRGETAPFILKVDHSALPFVEVDINFSLDHLPNSNEEMLRGILRDATDYAGLTEGGIRSLKTDDFFLHLIMHQYKESRLYSMVRRSKDTELYKLLDIYLFVKRGYAELSGLYRKIKKYGLERAVCRVMNDVSAIFSDVRFSDYAGLFGLEAEGDFGEVLDPPSGRRYRWTNGLADRAEIFDKERFLREVVHE